MFAIADVVPLINFLSQFMLLPWHGSGQMAKDILQHHYLAFAE